MLTDTHYTKTNTVVVNEIFEQAFQEAISRKIERIFHLGDVFTERTGQGLNVLCSFLSVLDRAQELGLTIFFISGNHDKTDLDSEESYLDVFQNHPAMLLHRKGVCRYIDGIWCHFLSYFKENGTYLERLAKLAKKAQEFAEKGERSHLFTHVAFNDVKNNDGSLVEDGVEGDLTDVFEKVHVGHYHDESEVGSNIYYIGSARANNFGENNAKGFTILHQDGETTFVQSKFKHYITHRIDLDEFNRVELDEMIEEVKIELLENHVKLIFIGTQDQLDLLQVVKLKVMGFFVEQMNRSLLKAMESVEGGEVVVFKGKMFKKAFLEFTKEKGIKGKRRVNGLKRLKKLE